MSARRLHDDRGTVLMLMPAGVLIVLVLGALAVDSAVAFLGERELADLTAAAANDAATVSIREDSFYRCGRLELDEQRARDVAAAVAQARRSDAVTITGIDVLVRNDLAPPQVTVAASGTVALVFTPALGSTGTRRVDARSVAVPHPLGSPVTAPTC